MTLDDPSQPNSADCYLELLKRVLTRIAFPDTLRPLESYDLEKQARWFSMLVSGTDRFLDRGGLTVAR